MTTEYAARERMKALWARAKRPESGLPYVCRSALQPIVADRTYANEMVHQRDLANGATLRYAPRVLALLDGVDGYSVGDSLNQTGLLACD